MHGQSDGEDTGREETVQGRKNESSKWREVRHSCLGVTESSSTSAISMDNSSAAVNDARLTMIHK